MDAEVFRAWIVSAAGVIEANRDHLTQLDAAIGDADHGIHLARGFTAVLVALDAPGAKTATPGAILTVTGNTLISKVGGASGPLYGVAFRRAGKALGDAADVDLPALSAALDAALAGVQQLGAAREGDKTMVDALAAATRAFSKAIAEGASPGAGGAGAPRGGATADEVRMAFAAVAHNRAELARELRSRGRDRDAGIVEIGALIAADSALTGPVLDAVRGGADAVAAIGEQ